MEEEHISNSDVEPHEDPHYDPHEHDDDDESHGPDDESIGPDDEDPPLDAEGPAQDGGPDYVTTEGLSVFELQESGAPQGQHLKGCTCCNKYYRPDMLVPPTPGDDPNESQCWHCFFWMNYSVPMRKQADGKHGMTISEYILKCKDLHELDKCTRNTDSGGCFLCEYNLGLPIIDIKDLYKLNRSTDVPDEPIDDDLDTTESHPTDITISI